MKHIWRLPLIAVVLLGSGAGIEPSVAQKLVSPESVAPEFREAAEKRRTEQIKQRECAHKANDENVPARDRTAFLAKCLDN
jgi:hypothetical protein